jgi:uncharacterized protein (TIGR00251 family)
VSSVRASREGVCVEVHVTPSAKKDSVRWVDGVLKVKTVAPADKGKANKAVVKLLKPLFGACEVTAGHKSRRKTVYIRHQDLRLVEGVLEGLSGE